MGTLQAPSSKDSCGAPFCCGMKVVWCALLFLIPAVAQTLAPLIQLQRRACIQPHPLAWSWQRLSLGVWLCLLDCCLLSQLAATSCEVLV